MADNQNRVLAGMFLEQLLKVGKRSFRPQHVIGHQLAFVAHFVSHQRGSLRGALQRAGNDDVYLHAESGKGAPDITALLNAVLIKGALLVFLCVEHVLPRARVP